MARIAKQPYCSIEDCDGTHYGRGWCKKHYERWVRNGDPLAFTLIRRPNGAPIEHGTIFGYGNRRCRCDLCRKANNDYHRETVGGPCPRCGGRLSNRYVHQYCQACRRELNRPEHGTESRYGGGCRCDECRSASTAGRRARRAAAVKS